MKICAPSNAAIDEIVVRLVTSGIYNEAGDTYIPRIIRVGPMENSENPIVKTVWIDYLLQRESSRNSKSVLSLKELKDRIDRLRTKIQKSEFEIEKAKQIKFYSESSIQGRLDEMKRLKNECSHLNSEYTLMTAGKSEQREKRSEIISRLMNGAEIICTTLNSSKSDKFDCIRDLIDTVVIDEAAQVFFSL